MPSLLPVGSNLRGRYRIHRTLHQSRLCNLYIAQDQHLTGKFWVVKEISSLGLSSGDRARMNALFQAEAFQVSALEHPNLPRLVDFFPQDSNLYLVREFIPGSDLASILEQRRIMPETEILNVGIQLCDLLIYLQSRRFTSGIYKNLKLSNIVMMNDGRIAMLDVGFTKMGNFSRDTMRNPDYAAPEQFTGEFSSETKTLVYNIGAMLYHMMTNLNPSTSAFKLPPMESIRKGLSSPTTAIIRKAVQNHPNDRPSTLQELKRGLDRAYTAAARQAGGGTSSSAYSTAKSPTPTWVWIIGTLLTLLAGGILVVAYKMLST